MSPTENVRLLSQHVYDYVTAFRFEEGKTAVVKLDEGGCVLVAANGDHVQVLVQSVHFEPGQPLPF